MLINQVIQRNKSPACRISAVCPRECGSIEHFRNRRRPAKFRFPPNCLCAPCPTAPEYFIFPATALSVAKPVVILSSTIGNRFVYRGFPFTRRVRLSRSSRAFRATTASDTDNMQVNRRLPHCFSFIRNPPFHVPSIFPCKELSFDGPNHHAFDKISRERIGASTGIFATTSTAYALHFPLFDRRFGRHFDHIVRLPSEFRCGGNLSLSDKYRSALKNAFQCPTA